MPVDDRRPGLALAKGLPVRDEVNVCEVFGRQRIWGTVRSGWLAGTGQVVGGLRKGRAARSTGWLDRRRGQARSEWRRGGGRT